MSDVLTVRPAVLSVSPFPHDKSEATPDEVFIADGWWKSWRSSPWAGTIARNLSFDVTLNTIRQLAIRGADFRVLESPEFETYVGFICTEGDDVLHYIFVKDILRERGFSKALLGAVNLPTGYRYTHRTRLSKWLPRGRHRPDIARRKDL